MLSDEDEKELWEERAAIREYLGGYIRKQAELLAYEDVQQILRGNDEKNNNGSLLLPHNQFQNNAKAV